MERQTDSNTTPASEVGLFGGMGVPSAQLLVNLQRVRSNRNNLLAAAEASDSDSESDTEWQTDVEEEAPANNTVFNEIANSLEP